MGITGLLPFLENASRTCHISEFRGATIAVDTYCWLHRGANSCAIQLARGEETQAYINYCMKYVKMLQYYNIRPILVFDGRNLPAKAETEAKRRESRTKAKQRAAELLRLGKPEEARTYLKQSINITPEMASEVIKECHKVNVDCIVAPYESDAQLAFFNLKGIAEFVITEDSDLLLFGCSKIIFKLDLQGSGSLVEADKIPSAMNIRLDRYTFEKFRYMCILSGCDYIESLRGIGLKKALKFITLTEETNPEIFLDKLPRYLNMRHLQITSEYKENFMIAAATFQHQTVFDPFKRKLVPLIDPQVTGTNPKHCKNAGDIFDHEKAYQVALGNLHPNSFKQLNNWEPPNEAGPSGSIWSGTYKRTVSHFEQKSQFRSYFTTSKVKVKPEVDVNVERVKLEEDLKIAKELEMYTKKSDGVEIKKHNTSSVQEDIKEPLNEQATSPVLNRNPFIKKKLSKFSPTQTDSQVIVKSRYFSQDCKVSQLANKTTAEEEKDTRLTEIGNKMEDACIIEISEEEITMDVNSDQKETIYEDIVQTEHINSNCDIMIEKSETIGTNKNVSIENTLKRKKIGPCKSVGLKRSKSESGTQQTIHQFFEKWKKK